MKRRMVASLLGLLMAGSIGDGAVSAESHEPGFEVAEVLHEENFDDDLGRWTAELEDDGVVEARDGTLIIDVPRGCTVWFEPLIEGPVMIEYEATVIDTGGPNDRVSDLNCFWMARDARSPEDLLAHRRSGKFADYNELRGYYVGLGGWDNTTTRFRRYIGDPAVRPLLPEHDLRDPAYLIEPNRPQRIRLVAWGERIEYWRDDTRIFSFRDPEPYASGWFGLRTVANHMEIRNFRVYRLVSSSAQAE